jgi:DNA-directed RNA polymerase II subunit RPB1
MTQLLRELQNVDKLESIEKIQFSLFSHEDINRGSVADVLTFDTYEGNMPKNNGLFDHNMGSIDAAIICPIDEKKAELCPGYFGKIDLALPVFNYHFMSIIEKVLKCTCFHCSKLLIDKNDPTVLKEIINKKGLSRFKAICELCSKNKKCIYNGGCQALQPTKYIKKTKENNNIVKIYAEFAQSTFKDSEKASNIQNFTPLVIYQIFKKIKDEDVDFLGLSSKYSRPEWMIINSLAIPPPSVRPSIRQSDNQRSEDDLTYGLAMIVKANKMLKNAIENNPSNKKNIDNFQGNLQYHISTYMDNEIPGVGQQTQRSTYRPLKAITQRLKGKEGRLRMNIMGKRVDYSARTVISVDPNLDIDQFGVPEKIARNLTFPEIVNVFNIEKLRKTILNGPTNYPGAKTVTKGKYGNQRNISLKHIDVVKVANELEVGDTVHRHLVDGDPCLFNRQPTLHKMSMMTHKIVILPYSTFRLNVTVCQPYNADFDGDEMNMHVPQSLQTQTELEKISLVHENLISPGNSKPSIEIVQDSLVGSYLLTIKDNLLNESQMYNYMMFDKKFNGKLPEPELKKNGINYWSGKQLFSLILPDINITQLNNLKVIRGNITEGYLSKDSLGKSQAGIIKQIFNVYGTDECVKFLNNTQKLVTKWLMDHSFSISFGDSILNSVERKKVINLTDKYYNDVYDLLKKAHHGTFSTELDDSLKHLKMEGDIKDILDTAAGEIRKSVMKNVSKQNSFYISGDWGGAGSKGTSTNMQQILGCVGQQDIWGKRIENGFNGRTLPHFHKNDIGPSAKGFCRNSYIQGLSPSEVFFHAMGGRTGSIDTAIQTAESGYISRKLIKAAEDLMVNYDLTVRNANGNIVQFAYGDDNIDPTKLEHIGKIELYELNNDNLNEKYKFENLEDKKYFENFMTLDAIDKMMENNNYIALINSEYEEIIQNRFLLRKVYFYGAKVIGDIETYMPVNLYRVISSQLIKFNIDKSDLSDLTPYYIISEFEKMMEQILKYLPEKDQNWKLFKIIFKSFISTKRILKEYRMSKVAFDDLLLFVKEKMISALITPGEMVGIIGAQTLGEISTQLTLNTFHQAGVGAASLVITKGVPRLKEILRLSKNLKSKTMSIYLKDEYSYDKEEVKKVQTKFAYTQIKDVLESSEIIYGGQTGNTSIQEDMEFIQSYKEFSELFDIDNITEQILSPWILRLKFDKESLMNKKITIQEIQEAIKEKSNNDEEIECIYSDDSAQDVIMRIRIKQESTDDFLEYMKEFERQLVEFSLRGITNIERAELGEGNIIKYNLDGSIKPSKEWYIQTSGSNLLEILNNNKVDNKRSYTNDILEFFEIFGIEATRELIFRELSTIFRDKHPNVRHIQILSDIMSYRGILMQIERHGLNKNPEVGPIAKASFEEVMNILTNSAVFAEKDNMNGVSSNIFAGQFCKSGTNSFEIMVDEDKLYEEVNDTNYLYNDKTDVKGEDIEHLIDDIYDKKEEFQNVDETDFNFGFGIENNKEFMLNDNKEFQFKIDDKDEDLEVIDNIDDIDLEDLNDEDIDNLEIDEINKSIDNLELEDIETDKIIEQKIVEKKPKKETKKKEKVEKKVKSKK